MKTFVMILLGTPVTAVVAAFLAETLSLNIKAAQAASNGVTSHTIRYVERFGDMSVERQLVKAIRSDRSEVELRKWRSLDGKKAADKFTVKDFREGRRVVVDHRTRSTTTYALSREHLDFIALQQVDCKAIPAGAEAGTMLGIEVYKMSRTLWDAAKTVREAWVAPGLECAVLLEQFYQTGPGNKRNLVTERRAVEVAVGEPPAFLFEIPTGYTERSPSEVLAEQTKLRGAGSDSPRLPVQDEVYANQRPNPR